MDKATIKAKKRGGLECVYRGEVLRRDVSLLESGGKAEVDVYKCRVGEISFCTKWLPVSPVVQVCEYCAMRKPPIVVEESGPDHTDSGHTD